MTIKDTVNTFWSLACAGTPVTTNPQNGPSISVDSEVFTHKIFGHPSTKEEILKASAIPQHALKQVKPNVEQYSWYRHSLLLFGKNGAIAQKKPDYEIRLPQIQLVDLIQRGIEMGVPVVGEGGTGTGKSFAYLCVAYKMGKRAVISAPTNALITQLLHKDLPFLQSIYPNMTFSGLMGKGNYFCLANVYRQTDYEHNGQLVAKTNNKQFVEWFESPGCSGTIQDYPHNLTEDVRELLAGEESVCKGCVFASICPYRLAKEDAQMSDFVVTNHALLCASHIHPNARLLPTPDVLIIDEAHELANYARGANGVELSKKKIEKTMKRIEGTLSDINRYSHLVQINFKDVQLSVGAWMTEVWQAYQNTTGQFTFTVTQEMEFSSGITLAEELYKVANEIWDPNQRTGNQVEKKWRNFAATVRRLADKIRIFSSKTPAGFVRYIEIKEDTYRLEPYDVADFLHSLIQPMSDAPEFARHQCALCGEDLSDQEFVYVLNGMAHCNTCIEIADANLEAEVMEFAQYLEADKEAPLAQYSSVLVSATLATGKRAQTFKTVDGDVSFKMPDFESFKKEVGITEALEIAVDSPFNYNEQLLLYVPKKFPDPSKDRNGHTEHILSEIKDMVLAAKGGAFLLFTSNAILKTAYDTLSKLFQEKGLLVLKQGEMSKQEIVAKFRESGKAVLFATRSYWTGIDIPGDALRLEVIDKLPFASPGPIEAARSAAIERKAIASGIDPDIAKWQPFDELSLPSMITALKQGVGRLIRTRNDVGVCAILDPRIHTAKYGRRIIDSLPSGYMTSNRAYVTKFFESINGRILRAAAVNLQELSNEELPF